MNMKFFYNVTGTERKKLVAAISQELNAPTKYLGAPTFAFQVGDYHIDKNGNMEGPGDLDLVTTLYAKYGFKASNVEHHEAEAWAERQMRRLDLENENVPDYSNTGPYDGDDIPDFEELQMTEGEELGLGKSRREDWQGENGMQADDFIPDESDTLTIEMPLENFTEEKIANLEKLIASKAGLIKKSLGIDALPIERTDTTLRFPWFAFGTPGEDVAAFSRFIGALYAAAKKQQRVTAKEHPVDNEKFAFRVFLIRLGFVGDEYKAARKILMRNLTGNSAYAKKAPQTEGVDENA
jgi:hypothetical protein